MAVTINGVSPTEAQQQEFASAMGLRERLSADRTYYVRKDGSDSNTGLADTAGGAFLTIQKAVDTVGALDVATHQVTILVRAGTYVENVVFSGYVGSKMPILEGDTTTPANVLINPASFVCLLNENRVKWRVRGFKLASATTGTGIRVVYADSYLEFGAMDFGACTSVHVAAWYGGQIWCTENYSITGASAHHWYSLDAGSGINVSSRTITITGTPAFSTTFAFGTRGSWMVANGNTYTGSATGKRYDLTKAAQMDTSGATLPGSVAGTVATNAFYY